MTVARLFDRHARRLLAGALVVAIVCLLESNAVARGGSGAMRMYMKVAQAQMKWTQQQMAIYQKQQKEQYDAFMKRFDTNKNGKIDGKEKGPAQKYLRALELGKDPDKSMKTLGGSSASFGPRTHTKPASSKSK
ncbi:MAG TPA: hypothetical protein VNH11_12170 [Pirellulales bacterium]|nr:hypothetical protein [Pirellulales bacterium]